MSRVVGPSMFCPTFSPRCIATLYSQTHPPTAVSTAALCVCVHALRYRYLCRGVHTLPRYTPQERTGFTGELYVDTTTTGDGALSQPQSQAYAALRLKRGASILSKATGEMFAGLQEQGYTQKHGPLLRDFEGSKEDIMVTIWPGDVFQVGGMFVLGPGNTCDYAYRSKFAGDHSNILDVLQAATGMPLAPVFSAPSASSASSASSAPRPLSGGAHGGRGGGLPGLPELREDDGATGATGMDVVGKNARQGAGGRSGGSGGGGGAPQEKLPPGFEYNGDGVVVCCSTIAKADYGQLRVLRERMEELLKAQVMIGTGFVAMFRTQEGMDARVSANGERGGGE